ncbi:MAG: hypothetical protein ACFE78_04390 [Candidatus Hodarchaeota archaeon]
MLKSKKIFVIYLGLVCFITSFAFVSPILGSPRSSANDIEWGVTAGTTYTWVVKESNTSRGFLPVDSKFDITVTSIISLNGGNATELHATITKYNSINQQTTTILNDQMFIYFNNATSTTSFYAPFYDHGFFMPPNDYDNYINGIMDYFDTDYGFDSKGHGGGGGYVHVHGTDLSADLFYQWIFIDHSITEHFYISTYAVPETQYHLQLEVSAGISYGYYFLIFTCLAIISLIYIYKKKEA